MHSSKLTQILIHSLMVYNISKNLDLREKTKCVQSWHEL